MATKVEAVTAWSSFEQVFDDAQAAVDKADLLEQQGWEVKITSLGSITAKEFCNAQGVECMDQLELIFSLPKGVH